jgi:hypothetical protein
MRRLPLFCVKATVHLYPLFVSSRVTCTVPTLDSASMAAFTSAAPALYGMSRVYAFSYITVKVPVLGACPATSRVTQ